jgi:hypothetical protein
MTPIDEEHLRLLGIFHYVYAGFQGLVLLGLLGYMLVIGVAFGVVSSNTIPGRATPSGPPPQVVLGFLGAVLGCSGTFMALNIFANVLSGKFLREHRKRMFCMIVAGIDCLSVPLGTLLGVFTLVVLCRDTVREAYKD